MLNLKLFTQLQGNAPASLILKTGSHGTIQFFVISATVNYSIVVSGSCEGELNSDAPISFDVVLSSLVPLLDKNNKFKLAFEEGKLKFVDDQERFVVEPLCVEHVADFAVETVDKYMKTCKALETYGQNETLLHNKEEELRQLENNYKHWKTIELSGGASSNPFGDFDPDAETRLDVSYRPRIEKLKEEIEALQSMTVIKQCDFSKLRRIANIAARNNKTIAMCDDYAVVDLTTAFVFQKADCGSRAIQGKLLQRLMQEEDGIFYEMDDDIVFVARDSKGGDSMTMVFLNPYLPNTTVNPTIITKGAVKEKYILDLRGMLPVLSASLSKFETMTFNMGDACVTLGNDRGEKLTYKFKVEDAKTLELNKMMRGEDAGPIVMSNIEVPRVVQHILPYFKDDFCVYVKNKKVIVQSGKLYAVFSK